MYHNAISVSAELFILCGFPQARKCVPSASLKLCALQAWNCNVISVGAELCVWCVCVISAGAELCACGSCKSKLMCNKPLYMLPLLL